MNVANRKLKHKLFPNSKYLELVLMSFMTPPPRAPMQGWVGC